MLSISIFGRSISYEVGLLALYHARSRCFISSDFLWR